MGEVQNVVFGASGIEVSRVGLGLAALGRPGYINLGHGEDLAHDYDKGKMASHMHEMLDFAMEQGINYFDVAQSYGEAEQFLSTWLKQAKREVVVGSKWGYYYTAGWSVNAEKHEIKDHSLSRLENQWPASKERLGEHLKLYQIHSATFQSGVLENSEVLHYLEGLKQSGHVIGLSLSGANQGEVLDAALKVEVNGQRLFGAVQATYNVLEQSAGESLQKAHDLGLGVIAKEVLANGRLTNRSKINHFADARLSRETTSERDAVSIAFALSKTFIHIVLSGAAKKEHLGSNLKATQMVLSSSELEALGKLKMQPEKYWAERTAMAWN